MAKDHSKDKDKDDKDDVKRLTLGGPGDGKGQVYVDCQFQLLNPAHYIQRASNSAESVPESSDPMTLCLMRRPLEDLIPCRLLLRFREVKGLALRVTTKFCERLPLGLSCTGEGVRVGTGLKHAPR